MVGSPFTGGPTTIRVIRETLAPLIAVPLFDAGESRPDSVDGVFGIRPKISEFPGEHGRAACGIDNPTATCRALAKVCPDYSQRIDNRADLLSIAIVKFEVGYLCRAP